ncbi:MAG TPA: hypothetical protein VEV42_19320 [Pyrinomonadaceae bacterium]|jgi:hypothetical protein|nr:hypothetical protein [Pyrinomonadaceae bacterium]
MKELLGLLRWRHVAVSLVIGCSLAVVTLRDAKAQHASLFGDDYYCPASQHSCDFTGGTMPYFAPDPFDVGAACDHNFLAYTGDPQYDQDGNGIDDRSCYGNCDLPCNTYVPGRSCEWECYANCQAGSDSQSGYTGCLRGAFGLGARPQPITVDPRNTPHFAGNILRSCLAGNVPPAFADQYNSCIASGGTVEDCCAEIANNFP